MDADTARKLVERLAAAWNTRNLEGYGSHLTDDVVWDDPAMPEPARGRTAVIRFSRAVLRAFPDFHYAIRDPICTSQDGGRCAVPWHITASHRAPLDPPGWGPTLRRAEMDGVDLLEFRGDRVCRIDTYFNVLVPLGQLTKMRIPPPPGSLRERVLVSAQRARAWWLRHLHGSTGP